MKHTPEPWAARTDHLHYGTLSEIYAGTMLVEVGGDTSVEEQEANTRRIVACVNACEGLSTEMLSTPGYRIKDELDNLDEQIAMRLKAEQKLDGWRVKSKQRIDALDKMLDAAKVEP